MITPSQLKAQRDLENPVSALTEDEIILLENLVKSWPVYIANATLFPDIHGKLIAEQTTPSAKTYFLRAVLAALNELPELNVETQGSDKAPGFFSAKVNWGELAQDVLNVYYNVPQVLNRQSYLVVQRKIENLVLNENFVVKLNHRGSR